MQNNPSTCTFGYDVISKSKAIICECAPGYVDYFNAGACNPISGLLFTIKPKFHYFLIHSTEFLVKNIPIEVAPGQTFSISMPSTFDTSHLITDCGAITSSNDNTEIVLTAPSSVSFMNMLTCDLTFFESTFQMDLILVPIWASPVYRPPNIENTPITVTVNTAMTPIALPYAIDIVSTSFATPNILFFTEPPLPLGIIITSTEITGTPTALGSTHFTLYALDGSSHLQLAISNYTITVVEPSASLSTGAQLVLEVAVPILLCIVLFLVVYVIIQRRRSIRKPFDFTDLVATSASEILSTKEANYPRELNRASVRMIEMLGKGSFGEVYKGMFTDKGSPGYLVAVKMLINSIDMATDRLQLLSEASLMVQFDHVNVVRMIGVVTVGDPLLLVIEYCEGGSLELLLQQCQIDTVLQHRFSVDCARGMAYLTSLNYVHRDLAARNVFVSSDSTAKIGDFGLTRANFDSEYYISKNATLSIRWSSPEALEERKFSEQSDVWSFGVLLYEIWSLGTLPYNGMSAKKVWAGVLKGMRLKQPSTCPIEIYTVMQSCWAEYGMRPKFEELLSMLLNCRTESSSSGTNETRASDPNVHQLSGDESSAIGEAHKGGKGNLQNSKLRKQFIEQLVLNAEETEL